MSPSRKPRSPKKPKPSHARQRHTVDDPAPPDEPPPTAPPAPPPHDLTARVDALEARVAQLESFANNFDSALLVEAVTVGKIGRRVENLEKRAATAPPAATPPPAAIRAAAPPADEEITVGAAALVLTPAPTIDEWNTLGAELLARHPHRLALAIHVARAATSGGGTLTPHEEDVLAGLFGEIVDEGIRRTGGVVRDQYGGQENPFARAAWYVLQGDSIRSALRVRPTRCPVLAGGPCPGDVGFVDAFRAAAPEYIRTVIAGATQAEADDLAVLLASSARLLDERYRPFAAVYIEDRRPAEEMEAALSTLTRRFWTNGDVCEGVASWASAFAMTANEHDIPPVARVGAIVWLAKAIKAPTSAAEGGSL